MDIKGATMSEKEKIQCIAEAVEMDVEELIPETRLSDLENWDSVAVLSIIAVINEHFNRFPSADEIRKYVSVKDLMDAMV